MIYARIVFIRRNGTDGNFYPLTSRTCLFGRDKECDIPIQLREVADNHCQINVKEDGEILLTNLTGNSTSVSLNGSPVINTVPLRHRDVFCIRKRSFRFEVPNPLQKYPSNMNAVSGAELVGVISQINSSDGSQQNEDTPQPLVMENTEHKNIETQCSSVSVTDGNNVETRSSTTILGRLNSSGLQMCHLRRIGPPATKPGVADVMDFWKVTSLIGRKATQIDFLIDSSDYVQGAFVSRLHARMVRRQNNIHRLFDDSLNGVFVNNFKIAGHVDLQVGDRVTFGHPQGSRLLAGTRVHQPDSEYQFMFEICSCPPDSKPHHQEHNCTPHLEEHNCTPHLEEHNVTRVPSSFRVPSELCVPKPKTAKKQRNATQTFTQEDIATCQSQNVGTSFKVEMNEDISDQEQNSIFKSADKMQTVPVRKDDSLETGHVGSDEVQQTGSGTEVVAVHRSVERNTEVDVEHNRISFEAILGHLQEKAVPETGPSGSGLRSNEEQQVVPTGSVTCVATMKSNTVTVIHQDNVPNRAVLNERKPGIGNQEEFIAEDLSSPGLEASIFGGQLVDNAGFRTVVNDSDVDMEAVDGEELVQNESPKDHQNLGKDDAEEGQAKSLSVEQLEPEQSANVLDNNVNAEQIFKCSDKSVTEIEMFMPEPDLDDEFNEIVMKVKTELLAVSSQGDRTNDAELGGDDTNSAQDKIYVVDSQVEHIHPNISSNGSMAIISAGESGAIDTEAVDKTEITELDHKIGLSTLMYMEVSGPVSHGTEDNHSSSVNSFDNKSYGKEEVFETGSALIVENIFVKDSRQPDVNEIGCLPMKSAEHEQLIQVTKEFNNDTGQQNIESVDTKDKVHGLINIVLKSVENGELKNTSFHQIVETSDMATHLASEVERTNGVPVSHNHDIVDNSHFVKDITSIQQQSVSVDAVEMYQNMAFHEKESSIEISNPGKQLNHVVETEKGSDNSGEEDFIFGEKEFAQEVSYTEGIMDQEVASFKMQDDTDKLISCFEEDFAKEASDTGQQDDDNTMSDRSLQNILVNEKATYQRDTSSKLNVLSGLEDNSASVLLDSRLSGIEDNSTSVLLDSSFSGIEDNSTSVLLDLRMEREQAVSLSQKESFEDISGEDNFSDITSIKDPFSEIMANPEEKMEPGHVFIGNNKVEFVSVNDGKSTTVGSVQGKDRDQDIFSFENKSFQDISNPEEDGLKLVASFEKESSEVITNPEEKIKAGQMSIENNNELEAISDLDGKSTIAVSVQEKDRDQEISSFEKKSFQDISHPEEKCFIPVASFEKQSSEVISDSEEKMEQGIVPVENNELQVVSDTRQNSATVLSDTGKERDHTVTSIEKKSLKDVSKPEEDNFSEVASFEEKSLESVPDPEQKIKHLHMSIENNELVLSDLDEKFSTVLSDQGKERDQGILVFQKESFENVDNHNECNFRNVASFEDSSSEVISKSEENMDLGHVTLEINELEVLSDLDEKSTTTVLSDQRKEWNHTVSLCEKKSFEDIPKVEAVRFKDIASFEKKSLEVTSNPEGKMEPGHVFIENNDFLSDLNEKSTSVLSVHGQERDQGIPLFEKETFEGISYPEEASLKLVASFENECSEVITNPEENIEPGGHVSVENNELEAISDLDGKSTTVVCVQRKERECDFSSFKKKSFQDISNTEELNFIPVASFEKETSEVTSDPEEKMEQGLVSVENDELDLDEKSTTIPLVQEKERNQTVSLYEKESFEDISNPEVDRLRHVASFEKESLEVITNPEEKIKAGQMSIENNNELEAISDLDGKSTTVLCVHGKEREHDSFSFEKKSFQDISNPKELSFIPVASCEKEFSEVISDTEERMEQGHVFIVNNEREVLSNFGEKSSTVQSVQGKERDQEIPSFEKESFDDISNPEENSLKLVASFEKEASEEIMNSEEKMDPGHVSVENSELEVISYHEKSSTVLSEQGKVDQGISLFQKENVTNPKEDNFRHVASFEDSSSEIISISEEKMDPGHVTWENNELEVLSDLDEKSSTVLFVQGKKRDQGIPLFEKATFEDISNPEEDSLKHFASFENELSEVINPEEKKEPGQMSIDQNNDLEVLSDLDVKSTTVESVQGKERNQTVSLCEKEFFEDVSNPEGDRLKHVASFEKESLEVITNPEEKIEPGQMSIENNNELEAISDLDRTLISDPGKDRDHAVTSFGKVSLQDISNPEEKMEQVHVSVEKYDLEFLSDLDEKSAKGEGLGAVILDDKSHDADKKCSNSLSYEIKDESYDAVCQDQAQERQPFSQLLTKNKMEISEHEHSFSDQSNTGDIREGTFQQGYSQDLFENSSQSNVSRLGCTDMINGIASAELKSVETVESVSKSGKKRKLSEIFQENDAADDDNGCVPTGVPFKKMLLPENEHSEESLSKDEVIKDKSLVHMDWYEMQSPLEHKIIDTKVVVENDTVESYGCATNSVQNTDSDRQQFLPENDGEIENNRIRKYFPGEDQSTLPNDCGGKTSEFKNNCAHDKEAICTVDDSSSSMNLTFSRERHYLPENRLETNEEFLGRVSSKDISDTENHARVEDCNVAMNDRDCNVESSTDSLRLLSSTGEFQITDMEDLSSREFKTDSTAVMSDENAELSDLSSDKDIESSELVSDKDAESSQINCVKGAGLPTIAGDGDVESSELDRHKDDESSELDYVKGAGLPTIAGDGDVESSELAWHKGVQSSELVSDKDAESAELVIDEDVKSELVMDKDVKSSDLIKIKDTESSGFVIDKDAELSELVIDKDDESSELIIDKDAESSEPIIDKDAELSELVIDNDAESLELDDTNAQSSELVMDKDAELSELFINKDAELSELVMDNDAELSELVIDKNAGSSELVIDKDAESSELDDTNAESSELVMDNDAKLSELVIDTNAGSSELVVDKDAESSELEDTNAESSALVMDKDAESSELVINKDAESSELFINNDAESSEFVIDEDVELSELVIDKDAESSELDDTNAESSELVMDNDAESSELCDTDAESSELVINKDAESSELEDTNAESSALVMDKDAESSELVINKDAESSELFINNDAESSEFVIDEDVELSELVIDKDAESSELDDTNAESSELVMDNDAESSELCDTDAESSELVINKDAESSELVINKDVESSKFGDTNAESSELVINKDAESSKLFMDKNAESSELGDKNTESSELGDTNAELYAESSELIMDKDAELSELVMDKDAESSELVIDKNAELSELEDRNAESSELVIDKNAESESSDLVDKDVESSKLVFDKDSELSENGSSGSIENDLYINDSSIKDNIERQYYIQDEETTSTIEPCDQSEGSSQRSDDLHTEPDMHPDLDTAKEKAWEKRGCGEEINRDVDELMSVQTENRDKQGEIMQLTDKSSVLNAKKTWQLSETRIKSETKSKEFTPYVEGLGEEMKPCSSPESELLISLESDDCDANSDVAMDTTENDTDSTVNDSTVKCLPFISAPVSNENVISVDQVNETSRCLVWSSNHLDDFSQQQAMSPVIPQQARIFPKASTADHDEILFSDQSDDDDNGISSLKISALVDKIQTTPVVDEAGSLLEKTPNFSSNEVSSSLEFKKEAISTSQRSDDSDYFNLDFSGIVDDVIYDDDERPVYDRYKDVSNVNPSDEEDEEDEDDVNENEELVSGNFGGNIEHVDMEDNENVDDKLHEITSDDNITDNVEEEEPDDIMLTRRKSGCSSGVKRKLKKNDDEYKSLPEKVRRSFIGPLDSPIESQKLEGKNQRCNKSDSSSLDSHGQGKNVSYPDQSDSVSTESELSLDAARSPSKYTSDRRQLEYKVKGKSRFQTIKEKLIHLSKDSKEESNSSSLMASSSSSQESLGETPSNSSSQHNQFPPEGDHAKITTLVTRCKSILEKFRQILNRQMDVLQTHRMQALIEELAKIDKWSELPQVVIAVVGNTGDGKSSLMNAILGHSSILPTSGIRACTAVVVEVVQNSGSLYEGCIEFLTKEEWYSELERLIKDLTSSDGKLRKNPPEPGTDQYVSYCKVKAVYGKIDKFDVLAGINKVTSHLGKKETVKCKQAKKFRLEVERYIETQEPQSGGQFWPIVKRVQLRLPNCDVCRTGAVLVDLPGVRDSNAARDKIARDYLKTCSAIWVVSAIHRAIDDKTAQDILTENFRRQLLMDGQYSSVAFICTKSDQFENSEIIRTLKLQDKCKAHEQKISIMEKKRQRLQEEIKICRKKTQNLNKEIVSSLKECEDLQTLVQEIETQQMDANQNQSVDYEPIEEAKVMVQEKEKEREKNNEAIQEIAEDIDNYERQIQELETQIRQRRRKLSHICASARNDYCREKIKLKFQSGLKEIKRQANRLPDADEDEEEEEEDEDAEEVNRMVNSLKVFCCSSTEYQKMKELIPADGEPTVFNSPEETEIPSLQAYVHELTRIRHEQYLERLIRGLGRCTFNFQSYLLDGGTECVETRTGVKLVIEKYLQDLNWMIQHVLQKMAKDLESTFNDMVQPKFHEGVGLAAQEVTDICQKWGSKQSTDQANRRAGGLHWTTYKATIQRLGVYSSPTFGNIDMNEELSEPFYRTIAVDWSRVFSSVLWKILDTVQIDILARIQQFNQKVGSELQKMGFPTNRIDQMKEQVEKSVKYKLTEMVLHLKPLVTAKQRDISRILSPHVQSRLVETYSAAASHTGKGSFQRMKQEMESGIDARKMYIFDDGSQKMMHELLNLKTELVNTVTAVCDMLLQEIQLSFEPLWEDPSQSVLLRDTLQQHMEEVCEQMKIIYKDASLQNTEEHARSRKKVATTQHPPTPKRLQERKNVSEIVNMFISPVPEELTKMTKLEVVKVEKGSHMYPVKDVKQKPGLSSDSGIHNPSDVASSSGIDVTRIKMEVLSEFSQFLHLYNVEPRSHPVMLSTEDSVNPTSIAGPSNVYDFGEASATKNIQQDQTHKKIKVGTNQRHNRIAPKNIPPEVQLALENHMVRRSKQQTENSSIAVAAQEEAGKSARGSSRAMVSLLKPKPETSTAANENQLAEISSSDSRQLIPAKRNTSFTSTMVTSSSGQAGTSLNRPKETTSKGTERNSCNIKGNLSSDLKRTAPSVSTGTTASSIKTPLSDKMGTSLPIIEDDDSLPEIFIAKRRKTTYREQNNPLHENVQENPTCTPATSKISQKISTDTSVSTSSISSRPRLQSNSETKATAVSKIQTSKETGSQWNKLRIEHSDDSSSSSEKLQIIKQEPQEVDHFPHKQRSKHKQNPIIIDLTLSDDE